MTAFLFPGQGAQTSGMGKDFYDHFPIARQTFEEANEILKRDLSTLIFEGPLEELTQTRNSQLGIYVTSIALLRVIERQFPSLKPTICSGLSLGEYTALTATGRLSFMQTLPLVQARGHYMHEACCAKEGTMAAIFGLDVEAIETVVKDLQLPEDLWVANFNCPGQIVISGTLKGVAKGIEAAKAVGATRAIPLKVHGAFHSGLMQAAKEQLAIEIEPLEIQVSDTQFVMNVPGNFVSHPQKVKRHLIEQVTSPVCWQQGIKAMGEVTQFIEIGPGRILTGLNKQIVPQSCTINVSKISDLDILAAKL